MNAKVRALPVALGVVVLALLALACDELHSFTFVNDTAMRLEVTFIITGEDEPDVLDEGTYAIDPGLSINTESERDLSGDRGQTIFARGALLTVRARSDGRVIFERTFTYDELKALDFRIEITEDAATPTPGASP